MNNIIFSILKLVNEHCPFTTDNSKQNTCPENCKRGPYYDFSPIDVCEDEDKSSYQEEFNQIKYALENDKVKNLAVLGKFGTGKSSLVSSFFKHAQINNKKISEKEYVTVSLADFDYLKENLADNIEDELAGNYKSDKDNTYDTTDKNHSNASSENRVDLSNKNNQSSGKYAYQNLDAVEKEIIRQLSYGKLSKNVPISFLSKFKTRLCDTFVISLYLSPLLVIFLSSFFIKDEIVHLFNYAPGSNLTKLFVLTVITSAYIFIFFKFLSPKLRFKNLSLSSLSISVEQKDSDNIIDAYLDEITYLFEQSECKYVIFEDLDRGNNPEVFTHLRNLNIVLNNDIRCKDKIICFLKRCQRRIVFIYLLRNDLLSPQEMVKFFDYTLSITPYATSSNIAFHALKIRDEIYAYYKKIEIDETSEDELKTTQDIEVHNSADQQDKNTKKLSESKIIKKSELFTEGALDNDFIISVSKFISDLRNIKQIFNDYQLLIGNFEFLFEDVKGIAKKLYSISALKSYCPSDYNQLISNTGKLYELLNRVGEYNIFVKDIKNNLKSQFDNTNIIVKPDDSQRKINEEHIKEAIDSKLKELENEFKNIEDKYSFFDLISKKRFDPDFCLYIKSRPLLRYLLCNNYLAEDYRFFISRFSEQFSLNQREYSFLRKVYDANSYFQPNYELSKDKLELIFSLLPSFAVNSKAIFNISLFNFALKKYTNHENEESARFLGKYIEICLVSDYRDSGPEFFLSLCSSLNNELKNKNDLKLNDQIELNILISFFFKSNCNIKKVIDELENPVQKSEFLLFIFVYGIQQNLSNIINSNNNYFYGFNSLVNVKAISTYILKGLNNIPQMYWKYLFSSLRCLYVKLEYAPTSKILGGNLKEFYFILDQWLTPNDGSKNKSSKNYLPFKINCENCSALANFLTSSLKEFTKNTDSQDLNCSNSFWSVLFDFKSEAEPSILNIRKTIFNYIFEQPQLIEENRYLRLLSVSSVIDKFNNLSKDESVTYLEDEPSIVFSFLTIIASLENEKKLKFSCDVNENAVNDADKDNISKNLRNEFYALLQKYNSKSKYNIEENSIKACFLDFENFCSNDFSELLDKAKSLLQRWHDCNLFESFPKDLNFELAKVETISEFLTYSYSNKVNKNTPRHRVLPNLKNVLFVRDYLLSFNLPDYITDSNAHISESISPNQLEFQIFESAWKALFKFYQSCFDEISQSSSHYISCPNLGDLAPNKIKEFFLNLDKQD